jgi:malonyl-CoA/methylmalonyl-CoA synthetase
VNLLQLFLDRTTDVRSDPFLTVPGGPSLSFGDVFDRADQLAGALHATGATVGDRLVAQIDKSTDAFALYLACLQTGIVYIPLNSAYTPAEVGFFLEDTGATVFVCRPADHAGLATTASAIPNLLTLGTDGKGSLAALVERNERFGRVIERDTDDLACMLYTSGTTGRSKGAMLTHGNLQSNGEGLHQVWAWEAGDVLLHILPIFHVHGLFVALHCALLNRSEVIYLDSFDSAVVRRELKRSTVMMGVPTHYTRLMADPAFGPDDCSNIRLFTSGSAPMTEQVFAEFTERSGHVICERYGMTECGIITSNPYDGDRIAGTVGYPLPGVEMRVMKDDGTAAAPGETGIVQTRGAHLTPGYWQLPEKTAEEMTDDGFFRTGDVGSLDESGRLTLAGRSGDMIISGGYNVYPKEIELILDEVEGVTESAVVGLPHTDFGEGVVAFIASDGSVTSGQLEAACVDDLARFKQPKHYFFVDELPRNTMGKIQKAQLRKDNAEFFGS